MIGPSRNSVNGRNTIMLLVIGLVLALEGLVLILMVRDLVVAVHGNMEATEKLRLNSRARISQASMRNTPRTEVDELKRLGRSTYGKRVVVGGDPDSELHTKLMRAVTHDDD